MPLARNGPLHWKSIHPYPRERCPCGGEESKAKIRRRAGFKMDSDHLEDPVTA